MYIVDAIFNLKNMDKNIKAIERLCRIHKLIQREQTGTPEEFAAYVHISRRTLFRIIGEIKDRGISVKYNRYSKTFYYDNYSNDEIKLLLFSEFKEIIRNL